MSKAKTPKYVDMICAALKALGGKGASRQAINKYIVKEYNLTETVHHQNMLRTNLKRASASGGPLVHSKGKGAAGSFKLREAKVAPKVTQVKKATKKPAAKKQTKKPQKKVVAKKPEVPKQEMKVESKPAAPKEASKPVSKVKPKAGKTSQSVSPKKPKAVKVQKSQKKAAKKLPKKK